MVLAIRIDIDNPFGLSSRFRRQLNRISINYGLIPRWARLGYLNNAISLRTWLTNKGVPTTWFFRTVSCPTKSLLPLFTQEGNQINLHAERTSSLEDFANEVRLWETICSTKVTGFTKHGSGKLKLSRMHDPRYDPADLMHYGKSLNLEYFIGNGMDYKDPFVKEDGFLYVPAVFWLDRIEHYGSAAALKQLIDDSTDYPAIVLVHPVWWMHQPDVRKNLKWLVENAEFTSIQNLLFSRF
ncbi:MAG: hypothetical protein ACFFCP_10125 [Promethearchaeota archaeon]